MDLPPEVRNAIADLPAELRAPVSRWFERLPSQRDALPAHEILNKLVRVVACSEFAAKTLLRYWPEIRDRLQDFNEPVELGALRRFADNIGSSDDSVDAVSSALRRQRNLRLLHILWREVVGAANVDDSLLALSDTADQLLRAAANYAQRQMLGRFGLVRDAGGEPIPLVILAMG